MANAPSPKADALRAMREAKFEQRRPEKVYRDAVKVLKTAAFKKKPAKKKGKKK